MALAEKRSPVPTTDGDDEVTLEALRKLERDLAKATTTITVREARYLVDLYYQAQHFRISLGHQSRTAEEATEPHAIVTFFQGQFVAVESQIKRALATWVEQFEESRWALSTCGIGPVIAAGLKAHIDTRIATSPSKLWAYVGLAPGVKWEKGQKRPWNAEAKVLCAYKLGESFVKVQNRDSDFYGHLFAKRKAYEQAKNEAGDYAAQAAESIGHFRQETEAYKWYAQGKLPPARIHARARRWAVKLFLAHYWQVSRAIYGLPDDVGPYVKDHLHHVDMIAPPNWPPKEVKKGAPAPRAAAAHATVPTI